jgi:hypothetical protein
MGDLINLSWRSSLRFLNERICWQFEGNKFNNNSTIDDNSKIYIAPRLIKWHRYIHERNSKQQTTELQRLPNQNASFLAIAYHNKKSQAS